MTGDFDGGEGTSSVLIKVVLRMQRAYGLGDLEMAEILGITPADLRFIADGGATHEEGTPVLDRAAVFVSAVVALEAVVGGNKGNARAWLIAANLDMGGARPLDLLRTTDGALEVLAYLEAVREARPGFFDP